MKESTPQRNLAALLAGVQHRLCGVSPGISLDSVPVVTVTCDSRMVVAGSMFVALRGVHVDGHDFIKSAIASGCAIVLCEEQHASVLSCDTCDCIFVVVPDSGKAYAEISANFFNQPAKKLKSAGVTGTNGKTTVTYLVEQVLTAAGKSVGVIGTVNNRYTLSTGEKKILPTRFTTPEAFLLQQVLWEMTEAGVEYLVMEVSSHALKQARVGTMQFDVAAFTNLSRDHLDYHPDMEDYFESKTLLFANYLKKGGYGILPLGTVGLGEQEIERLQALVVERGARPVFWGRSGHADFQLIDYVQQFAGTTLSVRTPAGPRSYRTPLVGRFNIDNVLTSLGILHGLGVEQAIVQQALVEATGAPGRLEKVIVAENWQDMAPLVLVDYAHTPDALQKVLTAAGALPHRELYCIFGCGGNRDRGKRPEMAKIAQERCHVVVVADDNPRTEDPDSIVAEIVQGFSPEISPLKNLAWLKSRSQGERGVAVIRDRAEAIAEVINGAGPGDIVVIAGKGHEPYQITLLGKRFFDDRLEAATALLAWNERSVAQATGGSVHASAGDMRFLGPVVTDSRVKTERGIFVALKGDNHDAHDFAGQAVANGCRCLVVERLVEISAPHVCQIEVASTEKALGDLAAYRRQRVVSHFHQKIIGLTGSCGKTTVKEMTAAILARMWPEGVEHPPGCILKTRGNFNNLIGLPISLLPFSPRHRVAMLEMGMNRPGELKRLAEIASPDIACILNVHGAHLEGLHSIEGVAKAKEELFMGLKPEGTLVINLDDPHVAAMQARYSQKKITFSMKPPGPGHEPDFWADGIELFEEGFLSYTLHHGSDAMQIHLFTVGEHNIANSLAAAAMCSGVGAGLEVIAAGLADFRPPDKRMQIQRTAAGVIVINDAYNANPASMAAGLRTLRHVAVRPAKAVAVVGDMLELGSATFSAHYEIGRLAADLCVDHLVLTGEFKAHIRQGAIDGGLPAGQVHEFEHKEMAINWLKTLIADNLVGQRDVILVKASRGRRFETIVDALLQDSSTLPSSL